MLDWLLLELNLGRFADTDLAALSETMQGIFRDTQNLHGTSPSGLQRIVLSKQLDFKYGIVTYLNTLSFLHDMYHKLKCHM